MAAAQRAGRYVDSMELTEKSDTLIALVLRKALKKAARNKELQKLATKRLQMVLHTTRIGSSRRPMPPGD
jgi:hypothetical protein